MKDYMFVAGMDFEFKGVDFQRFCVSRMKRQIMANRAKEDLRFQIFDLRSGSVTTNIVTYSSGKKTETMSTLRLSKAIERSSYGPVTIGGITHEGFKNGQPDVMSVLHIYAAVQAIGRTTPHSLAELSFFSHGWMGGPILVNSFDDAQIVVTLPGGTPITTHLPAVARDPDDKDPRIPKDFSPPTMDAAAKAAFVAAFRPDGLIWSWGCAFPPLIHQLLTVMERNVKYKDRGLGDDVIFTFTHLEDVHIRLLQSALGVSFPDPRRIEIAFKHLKSFFCRMVSATFNQQVAAVVGVPVFGALLGTYSEYDGGALPLMHVHKGFGRHFRFYQNYLGFSFDPEGRRYGKFEPGFTCPPITP